MKSGCVFFLIFSDYSSLDGKEIKGNCKLAFDVAASLGVPKLLDPQDMLIRTIPDQLAVMTYLFQLRAHFTGQNLEIGAVDRQSKEVTYTPVTPGDVHKKAGWKQRIFSFDKNSSKPHSRENNQDSPNEKSSSPGRRGSSPKEKKPPSPRKTFSQHWKKSPSPNSHPPNTSGDADSLMTRQQLVDPFHSDEEDEQAIGDPIWSGVRALHPGIASLSPVLALSPAEAKVFPRRIFKKIQLIFTLI
jgi:hypothetical protein